MVKIFSSFDEAAEAIPLGSLKLFIIDEKKIAVAHIEDGFHAFNNECPHQNEPLHKGMISIHSEIVCRLHQYRFSMKTGRETNNRCNSMNVYVIKIEDTGVFLDL